jgi:hypothetical protein
LLLLLRPAAMNLKDEEATRDKRPFHKCGMRWW